MIPGPIPDPDLFLKMPLWWDDIFLNQIQTMFAVVGAGLAIAAILYAKRVADRQFKLMDEQNKIVEKQAALAEEQTAISKRQVEMQEAQFKFFEEQLARKTDLRVIVQGTGLEFGSHMEPTATIRFHVHNGGNKSANGFYWEIFVPEDIAHWFTFIDANSDKVEPQWSHQSQVEHYRKIDGHYTHKLFPYSGIQAARLSFNPNILKLAEFTLKWRIRGEDGMVPPEGEGLAFLKFTKVDDGSYRWTRWHAGQKESDITG